MSVWMCVMPCDGLASHLRCNAVLCPVVWDRLWIPMTLARIKGFYSCWVEWMTTVHAVLIMNYIFIALHYKGCILQGIILHRRLSIEVSLRRPTVVNFWEWSQVDDCRELKPIITNKTKTQNLSKMRKKSIISLHLLLRRCELVDVRVVLAATSKQFM